MKAYVMMTKNSIVRLVPLGLARHYERVGLGMIVAFLIHGQLH